jgi:hypothetical protein
MDARDTATRSQVSQSAGATPTGKPSRQTPQRMTDRICQRDWLRAHLRRQQHVIGVGHRTSFGAPSHRKVVNIGDLSPST